MGRNILVIIVFSFVFLGWLNAADPFIQQQTVFVAGLDHVCQYRIPALVTTRKGTIIAICDARVDRPGDAPNNIDLVMKRSLDDGLTWEAQRVLVDLPADNAACEPSLIAGPHSDTVWLVFDQVWSDQAAFGKPLPEGVAPEYKGRITTLCVSRSLDEGITWSSPVDITSQVSRSPWRGVLVAPGVGICTRDGSLLTPVYSSRPGDQFHSHLIKSSDQGKSWSLTADPGPGTNESQVVELADGSLMLNMRQYQPTGHRVVATSPDGGQTWSKMTEDPVLIDPRCQASLIRYTDRRDGYDRNRLLFANPASDSRRTMTVRLSYDEGKTWPVSRVISQGPAAYSCLTVLRDGTIGLLYEHGESSPYETIRFARFNLEWLTEGQDSLSSR